MLSKRHFFHLFLTHLINSIKHEHSCNRYVNIILNGQRETTKFVQIADAVADLTLITGVKQCVVIFVFELLDNFCDIVKILIVSV